MILWLSCALSHGALITVLEENFNLDSARANLASNYPHLDFQLSSSGTPEVAGGILRFGGGADVVMVKNLVLTGEFFISVKIGTITDQPGANNVHMILGQNRLVFHPGYTPIPGAFRIEGPGGFSNVSMGFVPATSVLHTLEVYSHGDGNFNVTIREGNGSNVYTTSFYSLAALGGSVGLATAGSLDGNDIGIYDNLLIQTQGVPEPGTAMLFLLAVLLGSLGKFYKSRF